MDLTRLIRHPEQMDKETLYDLRSQLALYPYQQTARILMLRNLYILHDPSFDEELRRAAIYITDRHIIFNLVEAAHYQVQKEDKTTEQQQKNDTKESPTVRLIDNFLQTIPADDDKPTKQRKPTPADAAVDYVAYLLETTGESSHDSENPAPQMKGQDLIDKFIENEDGKFHLETFPQQHDEEIETSNAQNEDDEGYFTETLAKIYIKQGRYSKALEIIKQLNLNYPKKNAYFADQIRFLEKLIVNNNTK